MGDGADDAFEQVLRELDRKPELWDDLLAPTKYVEGCAECDEIRRGSGFGPPHLASRRCESGKRNHCTCDTCF